MKVREHVFGSSSEKELYVSLKSHWSKHFNLYPQLPFTSLVDLSESDLSYDEKNFLYSSSVDYTLCTRNDKPLVSVEFDGLSRGFSRNGSYVQVVASKDAYRKKKLDLKLQVCQELKYPLLVISYEEKVPIDEETALTIADGLIGQVLAHRQFLSGFSAFLEEHKEHYENLSPNEQHEYIQGLVIDYQVMQELEWNPLSKKSAELDWLVLHKGICNSHTIKFVSDPEVSWSPNELTSESVEEIVKAFRSISRMGCTVIAHTKRGDYSETAWVRNFDGHPGVSPTGLAEDIAKLVLARRLLSEFGQGATDGKSSH